MPRVRVGRCVYRQNADGSAGKKIGCSKTVEGAKEYLKALYSHDPKSEKSGGSKKGKK